MFQHLVFSKEGYPLKVVTDCGSKCTSSQFKNFLQEREITQLHSSVHYPQANGMVERFSRVLESVLQGASLEGHPLQEAVTKYLGVHRATPHSTTGSTPAYLLHGRNFRTKPNVKAWAFVQLPEIIANKSPASREDGKAPGENKEICRFKENRKIPRISDRWLGASKVTYLTLQRATFRVLQIFETFEYCSE